jgi:hypothetical protein
VARDIIDAPLDMQPAAPLLETAPSSGPSPIETIPLEKLNLDQVKQFAKNAFLAAGEDPEAAQK